MSEDDTVEAPKTTKKASTPKKTTAKRKPATSKKTVSKAAATKTATPKKTTAAKSKASAKKPAAKPKASAPKTETTKPAAEQSTAPNAQAEQSSGNYTFVEDLKDKDWGANLKRGLFMLIFGFVGQFALSVTFFLAFLQFIVSLLLGPPNAVITSAIGTASRYLSEILAYLSFKTDDLPFPFGNDFPSEEGD